MKRIILSILLLTSLNLPANANIFNPSPETQIRRLLESQTHYANKNNFKKLIATYDKDYLNSDGFNLEVYSSLIKDLWDTYDNIEYDIEIKNISVNEDKATVEVVEKSFADISYSEAYSGELKSESNSIYYLKKVDGKWKVISDTVIDETTTMLYGEAKDLNVKLSAPKEITPNTEYTASLEFTPPKDTIAIASIANDKIEYPQKQTEEVFRTLPEDNILERFFTSNNGENNEYVIASIGLTKTDVCSLNIKLSLVGFGYAVTRVNVLSSNKEDIKNVKEK